MRLRSALMAADDLVTLQVYTVRSDAEVVRAHLASAGIRAIVRPDDEGGLNPGFFADDGVRVEVRRDDLAAARAVVSNETSP